MIIPNGSIEVKKKTNGGINSNTGFPIPPTDVRFNRQTPCQYSEISIDRHETIGGGTFTNGKYQILIEEQGTTFDAEQIRLRDSKEHILGDFVVTSVKQLVAVGQVQINVG